MENLILYIIYGKFNIICCIFVVFVVLCFLVSKCFSYKLFLKHIKSHFSQWKILEFFGFFFVVFNSILYNHKKFLNVLTKIFMVTNEIFKIWNVTIYVTTNFFEKNVKFYIPKMKKFTWKFSFSKIKVSRVSQNFLLSL